MTTDKAAFIGDKRKVETFKKSFLKKTMTLLDGWTNEYELALAMGDSEAASKEKIKVDAMRSVQQLCEEASSEKTLDDVVNRFVSSIRSIKDALQTQIDKAKAAGEKPKEINTRIEFGIYDKPVTGFLWATLKAMGEDAPKYQEFMNRE